MTDFRALGFEELCERLCENKRTLIVYHVRSDADAVGSAFALRELLRLMNIPAVCACSDEVPERLRFLSEDAQGSVVPEEGMSFGHERVISVDSASPSQLGDLFGILRRDIDIMIDHHGAGTVYADNFVLPSAAATGEIIYVIAKKLLEMGKIPFISPRVYTCVYAAISSDTGCFRYSNVTPATHRIAAELIEAGVDAADINHKLFESRSAEQMRAEGEALRTLKTYAQGRVAISTINYEAKTALGLLDEHMETVIDVPRSLRGVLAAAAIRQSGSDGVFRVSMRSVGDIDVSAVCRRFGGGGHMRAAGCTVEARDIDEARQIIAQALTKAIE